MRHDEKVALLLLLVGAVQLRQQQRACGTRSYSSLIVFGLSALIVARVMLFPLGSEQQQLDIRRHRQEYRR